MNRFSLMAAAALVAATAAPAAAQSGYGVPAKSNDLVETAIAAGSFKTLVAAVQAAGLAETLKGEGPLTVFAPTDEAFAKLPAGTLDELLKPENRDRLRSILLYHVVPGKLMASDVVGRSSLETAEGSSLAVRVEDGTAMVDAAKIVKTDVMASNGVIHVIDTVVLPPVK